MKRVLISGTAIFLAWMTLDTLSHRLLLHSLYESGSGLWRPAAEMNALLIVVITLLLEAVFLVSYKALVRPKSLSAGLRLGCLLGVALGASSGFGSYIHSPIPLVLAWCWFILGTVKGLIAGGILGLSIPESGNE